MAKELPKESEDRFVGYHHWRKKGRRVEKLRLRRLPPDARKEIDERIKAATQNRVKVQPRSQFDHLTFAHHLGIELHPVKVRLFRTLNRQVDPEITLHNTSDGLVHTQGQQALWFPVDPNPFADIVGFELDIAKHGDPVDPMVTWSFTLDPQDPLPWSIKILEFDVDPPDDNPRLRVTIHLVLGEDPSVVHTFDVTL